MLNKEQSAGTKADSSTTDDGREASSPNAAKPTVVCRADGYTVDDDDMHWMVSCPNCNREFDCTGFYDPDEKIKCKCGCVFLTDLVA